MRNITKRFPGVVANDRVTLEVQAGEVHALLGENGAGKTTLVRILYGLYQPDAGDILIRGQSVRIRSPRQAIALGIGLVPQRFLLVHRHSVAENIALGLAGTRFLFPLRRVEQRIREVGERYGLEVDPRARIWQLSPGEQQRVEILKALIRGSEILILDEPTGLLTPQEAKALFQVLERMRARGHAIIFITHKLGEVVEIADRVTVLRRGKVMATLATAEADQKALARLMVGREVEVRRQKRQDMPGDPVLTVANLWVRNDRGLPALRGVSFTVHQREILGVTGVAGNGQRELVEVVTGLRQPEAGRVHILGREMTVGSARALFEAGMAHIPEERYRVGIVPTMSVAENLVLRHYRYPPFIRGPFLNQRAVAQFAQQAITTYDIATTSTATPVSLLSGGNIQKLILARELSGHPRVIVAAHPTYGLDVGATERIHQLLLQQREQGVAILLVSEDLEEVMRLSDRIMVLCSGEVMGIVPAATAEREQLGLMMAGVSRV
jgi:simple sugar transport system ATP-binding protein